MNERDIGLNDCLYRNMYAFHKMVDIDTDEIIAGKQSFKLWPMLQEVAANKKEPMQNMLFTFRNERYFTDDPRQQTENTTHPSLLTQTLVYHMPPESPAKRPKPIVDLFRSPSHGGQESEPVHGC